MKCKNCGKNNPSNSKYCINCGSNLEEQGNNNKENNKTNLLIGIGIVIVIILICLLGLGIYGIMNNPNDENTQGNLNKTSVLLSPNTQNTGSQSVSGTWHKVGSYSGVSSDSIAVTTKGSKFKVVSTAMPIKNYATNYLYTTVIDNGYTVGSSQLDWGGRSAVATKTETLEFSGSGNHNIDLNAYELQWWTVEVWDYY